MTQIREGPKDNSKGMVNPPEWNDKYQLEYSIHRCPASLSPDVYQVFRNSYSFPNHGYLSWRESIIHNIYLVPVWQRSRVDLLSGEPEQLSQEMDRLFENFHAFLMQLSQKIQGTGADDSNWIDASCPHTGKALLGETTNQTYHEIKGLSTLFPSYIYEPRDCCGFLHHPRFGAYGYPITCVTNLGPDRLLYYINTL